MSARENLTGLFLVFAICLAVWLTLPWTVGVTRSITFDQPVAASAPTGYWFVLCIDAAPCHTRYATELHHDHNTFTVPAHLKPGLHTIRVKTCAPIQGCSPETWRTMEVAADWTPRGWR